MVHVDNSVKKKKKKINIKGENKLYIICKQKEFQLFYSKIVNCIHIAEQLLNNLTNGSDCLDADKDDGIKTTLLSECALMSDIVCHLINGLWLRCSWKWSQNYFQGNRGKSIKLFHSFPMSVHVTASGS